MGRRACCAAHWGNREGTKTQGVLNLSQVKDFGSPGYNRLVRVKSPVLLKLMKLIWGEEEREGKVFEDRKREKTRSHLQA